MNFSGVNGKLAQITNETFLWSDDGMGMDARFGVGLGWCE